MANAQSFRTDWQAVRDTIDLAAVATNLLGPAPGRRGERGGLLWWNCPFHKDANPSFCVRPSKREWQCYGCGQRGDAAALVMRLKGWDFREARDFLTGGLAPSGKTRPPQKPLGQTPTPEPPEPSGLAHADAVILVENAERRLWAIEGAAALADLHGRGLTGETIRAARLGLTDWVTIPKTEGGGYRALGVVVPWSAAGRLVMVKIRQPDGRRPKYVEAFRDPARLVCYPDVEAIQPGCPQVIVEGEFDGLLLGQELSGLAAVVTLGSASARPGSAALKKILCANPWYIATDNDPAGDKAASGWPARARRVRPPGLFKDWTEAGQCGVNLRRWWSDRLGGNEQPPLFTWEELSARRWGPALDDSKPGLVIDRPDLDRVLSALQDADRDDPCTVAERLAIPLEDGLVPGIGVEEGGTTR